MSAPQPFVDLEPCVVGQGAKKVIELRDQKRTRRRRSAFLLIGLILIGLIGALAYGGFLDRQPARPSIQRPTAQGASTYGEIDGDTIRALRREISTVGFRRALK